MKTVIFAIALILALPGCMSNPQPEKANGNIETALVEYKAGRMKGSDYYTLVYNEISNTNASDKAIFMRAASTMIDASLAYESEKMTKHEFESIRRQTQTDGIEATQKHEAKLAQAQAAAFQRAAATMNAPIIPYSGGMRDYSGRRQTINCTSHKFGMYTNITCN